jgi:hypothetical protein
VYWEALYQEEDDDELKEQMHEEMKEFVDMKMEQTEDL